MKLPLLQFIEKAVPTHRRLRIHLGKNKDETIKDFLRALIENPKAKMILLVDSDCPDDGKLLDSMKRTTVWRKYARKGISADRVHWMVEVMESWFIADADALQGYYGRSFRLTALPKRANVEEIPKNDVFKCLKRASADGYDKTHAPRILEHLSPHTVRRKAPHCHQFLNTLSNLVA